MAFYTNSMLAEDNTPSAIAFKYEKIEHIKKQSSFKSIKEFETYYKADIQKCLNNRHNDIDGISCMLESDIWDRELTIAYQELYNQLNSEGKTNLKLAQNYWIQIRDLNLKLVFTSLSQEDGTMYRLMNAGEIDSYLGSFTKQRTLFLRKHTKGVNIK